MKKLSFKKKIMVLYTRCIRLLKSNLGGHIAHFFCTWGIAFISINCNGNIELLFISIFYL